MAMMKAKDILSKLKSGINKIQQDKCEFELNFN